MSKNWPTLKHWLTLFDPSDGEPYGVVCDCEIGEDHDGNGNLIDPIPSPADAAHLEHDDQLSAADYLAHLRSSDEKRTDN